MGLFKLIQRFKMGIPWRKTAHETILQSKIQDQSFQDIEYVLNVLTMHGHRHLCLQCGRRFDIGNLDFCIDCMSAYCWECENTEQIKQDALGRYYACSCGCCARSYDDWLAISQLKQQR